MSIIANTMSFKRLLSLLPSDQHYRKSGQGDCKEDQPDTEGISGSRNLVQFLSGGSNGGSSASCGVRTVIIIVIAGIIVAGIIASGGVLCYRKAGACGAVRAQ